MMWDFSHGQDRRAEEPPFPPMPMPEPSFPIPYHMGSSGPTSAGYAPSSYPPNPAPGFIPPNYMLPQYERTIYYGPNPPPMQSVPASSPYAPVYTYPIPQTEKHERARTSSHSHSHSHHHHSHSYSHPTTVIIPQGTQVQVAPPHHSAKLHKPSKPPTPTKHSSDKPLPYPPKSPHKTHQAQPLGLNPHFQYSKCTGRKKALCIGINYHGQPNALRGCINDAKHVRDFLISKWGYREGDIVLLSDDSSNPRQRPTRQNILDAMRWLVRGAKTNDSLFFHYSGHGGQTKDLNGDELDGFDEVIYPLDFKQAGHIVDDEMHEIMVKPLPRGCRLTALFDCCHSGTVLDLPYIYSSHGRLKGSHVTDRMRRQLSTPADVISWSGCQDGQTSADTFAGGVAVGAMSYAFITTLTRTPKQTYQELLKSVRLILHPRFSQKPQLGSSHHIDTTLQFVL